MELPELDQLRKIAIKGEEEFRFQALNGELFKLISDQMKFAAKEGFKGIEFPLNNNKRDIREAMVIIEELKKAGYACEMEQEKKASIIGTVYTTKKICIDWSEKK